MWLQHGSLARTLAFVGDSSGKLFVADPRKGTGASLSCTNFMRTTKEQAVDVHGNYVATASLDRSVKLFDIRKFGGAREI